jgi:hypothetical protein
MSALLDPWDDAHELTRQLKRPGARLILAIGAESWCKKCKIFHPLFETRARQANRDETWIWLDMEEHAEFIGAYLPSDLPMLICYENSILVSMQSITLNAEALEHALIHSVIEANQQDPGIFIRLTQENWAS